MTEPKRMKLGPKITPILSEELTRDLPLIDVYVGVIKDPKTISSVVVKLNSVLPVPDLMHLKRVRGKKILLFPKKDGEILDVLKDKGFDFGLLEDDFEVVAVAKVSPKVRRQYEVVHQLWPCNFHSNSYLEKLSTNTVFTEKELEIHANFMRVAIEVGRKSGAKQSSIIVDPKINSIVAIGFDESGDYPIKHSVMVAIDNVAKTQNGGVWTLNPLDSIIKRFIEENYDVKFGFSTSDEGPYLCTGYYVYATFEPCITCAMALVHSRVKRVFYGAKNTKGGLGSLCKIHVVENMNHHYEAFAGLLEEECVSLQSESGDNVDNR